MSRCHKEMKLIRVIIFLGAILAACGGMELVEESDAMLVIPQKALSSSLTLKAYATVDDTSYDLTVFTTYVGGTITGLSNGEHTVTVHLQAKDSIRDIWIDIITVTKEVTVSDDATSQLQATAADMVYPDNDSDGVINLDEITAGTNPNNATPLGTVNLGSTSYVDRLLGLEYHQCGRTDLGILLPRPFQADKISLYLTNVYSVDGYIFVTGLSKWQIRDADDDSLLLETGYTTQTFTTDNGMTCDWETQYGLAGVLFGNSSEKWSFQDKDDFLLYRSFYATCSKNGETCVFRYYCTSDC